MPDWEFVIFCYYTYRFPRTFVAFDLLWEINADYIIFDVAIYHILHSISSTIFQL